MNLFERIAEEKIQRALEAGEFDHLSGYGKPLNLNRNPFEDPEQGLANHLLHEQGFTLPWIELRLEIEREFETARHNLYTVMDLIQSGYLPPEAEAEAYLRFEEKIRHLNRRIFLYNLQAPTTLVHRPLIQLQQELSQLQRRIQPTKS